MMGDKTENNGEKVHLAKTNAVWYNSPEINPTFMNIIVLRFLLKLFRKVLI